MEQQLKAEELFDKDEAFLFTMIGNELGPLGFAFDNRDDEEKRRDGRKWFKENIHIICKYICTNSTIQKYLGDTRTFSRIELAAAIADIIVGLHFGISPIRGICINRKRRCFRTLYFK